MMPAAFAPSVEMPSLDLVEKTLCERSLRDFVETFWHVIEPVQPFVSGWHIDAICDHLEAITRGQIKDLLINVPPGCMKSLLVSVFWPAWEWTRRSEHRFLCASYDEALAIRDNRRHRDIITSPQYQRYWPLDLRHDQDAKTRFDNVETGWRIGTSIGGRGTGEHPHRIIVDDPHNVKQSLSDAQRQQAMTWFALTMGSRGLVLDVARIVIMQRLHDDDLSGYILREFGDQFVHLCLPMRYEPPTLVLIDGVEQLRPRMKPTPLGFQDPRTERGELLFPHLFTSERVEKLEKSLRSAHGEFGVAGQLQQRPVPMAGGMFKREWFPIIPRDVADAKLAAGARRCRGWDGAGTDGDGDYTAGVKLAICANGDILIEDVVRGQWGPGAADRVLEQTVRADGRDVRQREEQEPGSAGKKLAASHLALLAGFDYRAVLVTGDKETRARPFAAQCEGGRVCLVEGAWNAAYINELVAFPRGAHDDQVDGSSTAYNELALGPAKAKTVKIQGF